MKIITISGIDGSGKSTQAKLLTEYFRNQGKKVFYFHAIDFSLAKKISNLKDHCLICHFFGKCKTAPKDKREKGVIKANCFQIWLRKFFLQIDIKRFEKSLVKLEKQGYDYILSDRYFLDTAVNIEYLERKSFDFDLPIQLKPDKSFFLSVLPKEIMQRDRVPDQGLEYLVAKQDIFEKKASQWNMIFIDGNDSVDEVFNKIQERLN